MPNHKVIQTDVRWGYSPTPKLLADKPQVAIKFRGGGYKYVSTCDRCPHVIECDQRQKNGLWVLCEIPDELDLIVLRGMILDERKPIIRFARDLPFRFMASFRDKFPHIFDDARP